ncbi:MAG: 2,3,4,5-tetrahydropyridine-2,6-dicarboxylate N-succinyltransferase [Acidobacteriia bacterium]|nr:2,3,4,5-tetrahydropyridine-2,6-dicarboxylate N-succinyltransferase [Terriglobia bacterium]
MSPDDLQAAVELLAALPAPPPEEVRPVVEALLTALESGRVRAAVPDGGSWRVNAWVRRGIVLAFRSGVNADAAVGPVFRFRDRDWLLPDGSPPPHGVRIVPGGTVVRRGAHLEPGVVVMPPAYVNVGAWVGERSMIDSHALVGSCAQVGRDVHLSAASQIGGVLEPVGALPVIVEDGVFVGGGCGIYEGTRVRARAVLAAGVILARSVPLFDLVHGRVLRAGSAGPLDVPEGAVVVPGARPAAGEYAARLGIHLQAPVIAKYRDDATDAASALEEALR